MERFAARLSTYLDAFKSQPGTYAAGGPEWQRRRRREAQGIPIPDGLHGELRACAASFNVTFAL
jgi:LDH2 family malate/lactate/ureidoglycolate dehydrogenase